MRETKAFANKSNIQAKVTIKSKLKKQFGHYARMKIAALKKRLRTDFQLSIIMLFGVCSMLLILPFAIYRVMSENWLSATLDFSLVFGIACTIFYAWYSGNNTNAGRILVLTYSVGAVVSAEILGVSGLFWAYGAILANFFLLGRRAAVTITAISLIILVAMGKGFENTPQIFSFVATTGLVSTLAFILANRTEAQRVELELLATRDALTGIYNRRAMTQELSIAVEANKRHPGSNSLIILDLDNFKSINDKHGHAEGDRVLVNFAELITQSTRQIDRLFRYGGEEFVLLLPAVGSTELFAIAEKLRLKISNELRSEGAVVTVSLGAAELRGDEGWQDWLRRADDALYAAKSSGRNCTVVA